MPPEHIPHGIARSGWLFRQTTILQNWKRAWVVFYTDGRLAYFDDQNSSKADDCIHIPRDKAIIVGPEYCKDVNPPVTKSSDLLFSVKTKEKQWNFCADDKDELMAWKFALQEAFNIPIPPHQPSMAASDQYRLYAPPGSTIVITDRGPTIYDPQGRVIYVCEDRRFYRDDACCGLLAGAALGSMLFWPWIFFW